MASPSVRQLVATFERSGVEALGALVRDASPTKAWLDRLVEAVAQPGSDVPASWVLRALLERGVELEREQTARLLRSLEGVRADDARLHVCQSVGLLEVPTRNAEALARFLRAAARGEHKFLRAWGVDGFQRLALQHVRYKREARQLVERALRDPAASVRARARNIVKELGLAD